MIANQDEPYCEDDLIELDSEIIIIPFEEQPKQGSYMGESKEAMLDFLKNVRVSVLFPESESQIMIRYFYKIDVTRGEANYILRRSYSSFEWLYNRMVIKNKGLVVPSIPGKDIRANLPLVPDDLLHERRKRFNRFLNECLACFGSFEFFDDLYFFLKSEDPSSSNFQKYMDENPHCMSFSNTKEPIQEAVAKSIANNFFKMKENFWDKFE